VDCVERHRKVLTGEIPDRVPVAPSLLVRPVRRAGLRQRDYHTNPDVLARTQVEHCDAYDFDGMIISSDNVIMYEALGGRIVFQDDDSYPFWTDPLVRDGTDLARLKVPDPERDGRMPVLLEASRLAARAVGRRRFIMTNIDSGPFQLASTLMGMEHAMVGLAQEPALMKEVLAFCAEVAITYGQAMARTGCHALQFGESTAAVVGRRLYEEIIWPEDRRVIAELRKTDVKVFLHVCGDSSSIMDLLADSGADCLEIDSKVDLAWAKDTVAGKLTLKGNVDTGAFVSMPRAEFMELCRRTVEAGKRGGRFILCGGCEVPPDTPDEILHGMRRSADLFGTYKNSA